MGDGKNGIIATMTARRTVFMVYVVGGFGFLDGVASRSLIIPPTKRTAARKAGGKYMSNVQFTTDKEIRSKVLILRETLSSTSSWEDHNFSRRWLLRFALEAAEEVLRLRKVLERLHAVS